MAGNLVLHKYEQLPLFFKVLNGFCASLVKCLSAAMESLLVTTTSAEPRMVPVTSVLNQIWLKN